MAIMNKLIVLIELSFYDLNFENQDVATWLPGPHLGQISHHEIVSAGFHRGFFIIHNMITLLQEQYDLCVACTEITEFNHNCTSNHCFTKALLFLKAED